MHPSRLKFYSLSIKCLLLVLAFAVKCSGQAFSVEGMITYRAYANNQSFKELHRKVVAHVNGPQWLIQIDATMQEDENDPSIFYEAGFDGENIYCYGRNVKAASESEPSTKQDVNAVASIFPNRMLPSGPTVGATFAWFTFAPDAQRLTLGENLGKCIWEDVLLHKHNIYFPVSIVTNSSASGVTVMTVWRNDGKIRFEDSNQNLVEKSWYPPYDTGYTNAIYTVTYTNINGVSIPIQARLVDYGPEYPTKSPAGITFLVRSFDFLAVSLKPECQATNFRPSLPPMTLVNDRRLAESHPAYHPAMVSTNGGQWQAIPLEKLAANCAKYEAYLKKQPSVDEMAASGHTKRIRRQVIVGCMALASLCVLVFVSRRTRDYHENVNRHF